MKNTVGCIFCLDKKDSYAGENKRDCFSGNQILGGKDEYKEQDNSDVYRYDRILFCDGYVCRNSGQVCACGRS